MFTSLLTRFTFASMFSKEELIVSILALDASKEAFSAFTLFRMVLSPIQQVIDLFSRKSESQLGLQ